MSKIYFATDIELMLCWKGFKFLIFSAKTFELSSGPRYAFIALSIKNG